MQILNMSIDAPNAVKQCDNASSDNFNYMDSFVEYVTEVVLKYENAIPESKDRQQKELQSQKQFELVFQKIEPITVSFFNQTQEKLFINFSDKYAYRFINEIVPPPPKA